MSQLCKGNITLAFLRESEESDFPWQVYEFVPTLAFAEYAPLFEAYHRAREAARRTGAYANANETWKAIWGLGFSVVHPDGDMIFPMGLHIYADANRLHMRTFLRQAERDKQLRECGTI